MRGRWWLVVATCLLVAGAALLGTALLTGDESPTTTAGPDGARAAQSGPSGVDRPAPDPSPDAGELELLEVQQAAAVAAPSRVEVPSLGISSSLDRLGTDARGRLDTPPRWQAAGWFAAGPRPGDDGPAVIAGHVDSPTGPAVFARLSELAQGDVIRVTDTEGEVREFAVTSTTTTPQDGFPTDAVYGPTPDPQLRLITCDGPYDAAAGGYQDNLLVFATEVDA